MILGSSYLNTLSLPLECRVIGRPAGLALNWPGSYPFPPGLVVWWVPLLLGGGAGLPSLKLLWFSNEFNKPVLVSLGCRDAFNQVLSVHPALSCILGSSSMGSADICTFSCQVSPGLGSWNRGRGSVQCELPEGWTFSPCYPLQPAQGQAREVRRAAMGDPGLCLLVPRQQRWPVRKLSVDLVVDEP